MGSEVARGLSIAIIGGGISGLMTAIALHNHSSHISFTIYEAAHEFTETGGGISFASNAGRAMHLISAELENRIAAICGTKNAGSAGIWLTFCSGMGLPGMEAEKSIVAVDDMNTGLGGGVRRSQLLDVLASLLPNDCVFFGKRLVDIGPSNELTTKGKLQLRFEDGSTAQHDAVIGCDGIKSKVRRLVLGNDDPAARPVFAGMHCYRNVLPMEHALRLLGSDRCLSAHGYLGYGRYIVTYPIANGTLLNLGAFVCADRWTSDEWLVPGSKEQMLKDFDGWGVGLYQALELCDNADVWALFETLPAKSYFQERMCLVGDAAHGSTPHQGAGAGMGIEDAYALAMVCKEVQNRDDFVAAFRSYDSLRRYRTQGVVETSKESGRLLTLESKDIGDDVDKIRERWETRMNWIFDYDLETAVGKETASLRDSLAVQS